MKKILLLIVGLIYMASIVLAQNIVDFEDLTIEPETHWNGSDLSGSVTSGYLTLYNQYESTYSSWMGFAYTNETDNSTYSWENMYTSASGSGAYTSENYAVSYIGADWMNDYSQIPSSIKIDTETAPEIIPGMFVSLNANSSLYMADNDFYESGNHWLKLRIIAYSTTTWYFATRDFILADYRFEAPANGFKLSDWSYIDMSWTQGTDSLTFLMLSDDEGDYGLNTPTYFCIDNFGEELPIGIPQFETEVPNSYYIETGGSAELLALAKGGLQPYTFAWSNEAGLSDYSSQTPMASPVETTTWTVTITDALGAEQSATVTVWVSTVNIGQISNFKPEIFIDIDGNLVIESNKIVDYANIYDVSGKLIKKAELKLSKSKIDLSALAKGIYIVKLISGDSQLTQKIVK